MPLDLLVSDLLLPPDAPATLRSLRLPNLEKWLVRADTAKSPSRGMVKALASLYGLAAPEPVAAISLVGENRGRTPFFASENKGSVPGSWLRADPVHLRVDHDYVRLHDASSLDVTHDEAATLVAALQAHFGADGLEFHAAASDRWYVRVPEGELPKTRPLPEAFGRDVFGMLPEGNGRINWRAAITEAQMTMSAHEVNALREAEGKPAINSVWFWGEGAAPSAIERRYALVHASEPFARGLGALSGAQVRAPVATLADVDLDQSVLVVIDALTAPLHRNDPPAWREIAERLENDWFASLGGAVERFGEVRVILPAENATHVATLTPAARWRWFRARKPLVAHA